MTGFLLIDKPSGPTSHDIVHSIRQLTHEKRVGHAGTLDPFASGLLIVGVGREATRELGTLIGLDKTYEAIFVLGSSSNTDDRTGILIADRTPVPSLSKKNVQDAADTFVGNIVQIPPRFAAIKIQGKKLYEYAREGIHIDPPKRRIRVHRFTITRTEKMDDQKMCVWATIVCSSGTYIRALARDVGTALGMGGYVEELQRTTIGPFHLKDASRVQELKLRSIDEILSAVLK